MTVTGVGLDLRGNQKRKSGFGLEGSLPKMAFVFFLEFGGNIYIIHPEIMWR